ncbi:Hypothetical protein NTJ_08834 [Nesidiocoris tenuis]|nr:Hypothetical protein NTJ_08834 [Nesidiocoris tenuis]
MLVGASAADSGPETTASAASEPDVAEGGRPEPNCHPLGATPLSIQWRSFYSAGPGFARGGLGAQGAEPSKFCADPPSPPPGYTTFFPLARRRVLSLPLENELGHMERFSSLSLPHGGITPEG